MLKFSMIAEDAKTGDYKQNITVGRKDTQGVISENKDFIEYKNHSGEFDEETYKAILDAEVTDADRLQARVYCEVGDFLGKDLGEAAAKIYKICKDHPRWSGRMNPKWLLLEAQLFCKIY